MSLSEDADTYFSSLNPMAARIYADLDDTRASYECVWDTLSHTEQSQILNERIIKPEVVIRYLRTPVLADVGAGPPYGQKRVIDDNLSYRDEHSAPFSFRTASQMDLRLFDGTDAASIGKALCTPKMQPPQAQHSQHQQEQEPSPPPSTPPQQVVATSAQVPDLTEPASRYKTDGGGLLGKFLGRRHSPDSEQEILMSPDAASGALPKTGLDFLDNW